MLGTNEGAVTLNETGKSRGDFEESNDEIIAGETTEIVEGEEHTDVVVGDGEEFRATNGWCGLEDGGLGDDDDRQDVEEEDDG